MSLSPAMRDYISQEAARRGIDQSAVVEEAVKRMFREERRKVTQASLLANAEFDLALVEEFRFADAPLDDYPWEE